MSRPTLGVLITYCNEGTMLTELLDTLAGQAIDEIVIYDDFSSDPPHPYIPAGLPVRVIRGEQNLGPAVGRNRALAAATADYVHFHDADDWFAPEWSARVRAALAADEPDCVYTEIASHFSDGVVDSRVIDFDRLRHYPDFLAFSLSWPVLVPSGTFRRELCLAIGGYDENRKQAEDYDFSIRIAEQRPRFVVIDEPLVMIRIRAGSRSTRRAGSFIRGLEVLESAYARVGETYRPQVAATAERFGRQLFALEAKPEAARAFALAERLGARSRRTGNTPYDIAVRSFGFETAERLGATYRRLLPGRLRQLLRGDGGSP